MDVKAPHDSTKLETSSKFSGALRSAHMRRLASKNLQTLGSQIPNWQTPTLALYQRRDQRLKSPVLYLASRYSPRGFTGRDFVTNDVICLRFSLEQLAASESPLTAPHAGRMNR